MPNIHHSSLIDLMGGTVPVAKAFQVSPQAVSKWRRIGIPRDKLIILDLVRQSILDFSGDNGPQKSPDLVEIVQKIPLGVSIFETEGEHHA